MEFKKNGSIFTIFNFIEDILEIWNFKSIYLFECLNFQNLIYSKFLRFFFAVFEISGIFGIIVVFEFFIARFLSIF